MTEPAKDDQDEEPESKPSLRELRKERKKPKVAKRPRYETAAILVVVALCSFVTGYYTSELSVFTTVRLVRTRHVMGEEFQDYEASCLASDFHCPDVAEAYCKGKGAKHWVQFLSASDEPVNAVQVRQEKGRLLFWCPETK